MENSRKIDTVQDAVDNVDVGVKDLRTGQSQLRRDNVKINEKIDTIDEKVNSLGKYIKVYWNDKKEMAQGADTPVIRELLEVTENIIVGGCACGAGAGGFVFLVLRQYNSVDDVKEAIRGVEGLENCTIHRCTVNETGVSTLTCDGDNVFGSPY